MTGRIVLPLVAWDQDFTPLSSPATPTVEKRILLRR